MIPLGYAPEPIDDEPLDGWLDRLAAGAMSDRPHLLREMGLPAKSTQAPLRDFRQPDYERLAQVTDIPVDRLQAMTFQRWHHLGLAPTSANRGHQGGGWARTNLFRHCPECLSERDGIHRIQWRVVWSFACVRHRRILAGSDPRATPYGQPRPTSPSVPLADDHPAVLAQQTVDSLLDGQSRTISSLGHGQAGPVYLSDLGALARVVVNLPEFALDDGFIARLEDATRCDWSAITHAVPRTPLSTATPAVRLSQALGSPALTALAAGVAHGTLAATSPSDCAKRLWWMPTGSRKELMWHAAARQISFPMWSALAEYGTCQPRSTFLKRFHLTRFDQHGELLVPIDPTKIPSSCWASVVKPSTGNDRDLDAVAASAALLIIASERPVGDALQRLGLSHLRRRIQADWGESFDDSRAGTANFEYLVELHRALASIEVPIDYARRRRTFSDALPLGRNTHRRLTRELHVRGSRSLGYYASWYLHEILTGSAWLMSAAGIVLPGGIRAQYRLWRSRWSREQPQVFMALAAEALYRNNIDEPVTWRPERHNGEWINPLRENGPYLDLWQNSHRPQRRSARLTDIEVGGYSLADTVVIATGDGPVADLMRRDLRRFEAVAAQGSFTRGAHVVGVNPGTLSVAMTKFESRLGHSLFDRSTRPVTLTASGRRLAVLMAKQQPFDPPSRRTKGT